MKTIVLPYEKKLLFEGMTPAQLHMVILQDDDDSKLALWYLLFVRIKSQLWLNFQQFFEDRGETSLRFEDYLCDFFLYVYEYRPKDEHETEHYYMLQTLKDNTKMFVFLQNIFKRFMKEESDTLNKIRDAEPQVIAEQRYNSMRDIEIDMHRIGYALACLCQSESDINRYILFRAISHRVLEDYSIIGFPPDEEVAAILGLSYANYRTRASRLFQHVRDMINNDELLPELDVQNRDLMVSICSNEKDLIEVIRDYLLRFESSLNKEQRYRIYSRRNSLQDSSCLNRYSENKCSRSFVTEPCGMPMVEPSIKTLSAVERMFRSLLYDYKERREGQKKQLENTSQRNNFASKFKKLFSSL